MAKINELLKTEVIPLSEELSPLDDPESTLKTAMATLGKTNADWNHHFDAVTLVRRVVVHNSEQIVNAKLKNVIMAVLDQVDNLRSLVSRNAITCMGDIFVKLGKLVDAELDYVLPRLLKKYGESNKFYEEETDRALKQLIANTNSAKSLSVLILNASHKNVLVRSKVALFIATCITGSMGARVLKFKELPALLKSIAQLLQDGSSETRIRAKQTVYAVYNYMTEDEFEKLIQKHVSPTEVRVLKETITKLKKEQSISSRTGDPSDESNSHATTPVRSPIQSSTTSPVSTPAPTNTTPSTPTHSGIPRSSNPPSTSSKSFLSLRGKNATETPEKKEQAPPEMTRRDSHASGKPPAPSEYLFKTPTKAETVLNDMEENISVAVRVRPMAKDERGREIWKVDDETQTVMCVDEVSNSNRALQFTYDYTFGPNAKSTQDIYEQIGQNIVYSVMEGYNGTIFAYGQTNSGKTYTMMGNEENPGFIPLAIASIFDYIKNTPQREFLLRVSYLEIYNEVINDLLRLEGSNLNVREDKKRGIFVDGLKEEIVVSPEHVMHVINSGEAHRHVASTDYNLISSRSHTIFRMIIESNLLGEGDKRTKVSGLTLIDLAGSEKVVSESSLRKREGAFINKSLLTLGTIISKLSERKKGEKIGHLPYRDSKLTRILEHTLSGNSKIAIIATITPASPNFEETTNTLKFATRAKKVTKEKATINIDDEKALLAKYKHEIEELRSKLVLAEDAEKKLKELQDLNQSQQVEELKRELSEQEELRTSLEEKIKQLTKLILVSANVDSRPRGQTSMSRRDRSITLKQPSLDKGAPRSSIPVDSLLRSSVDINTSDYDHNESQSTSQKLYALEKSTKRCQ